MSGDQEMLTVKQVAERLNTTPKHVYTLIRQGDIPSYRLGRVLRVSVGDLNRYLRRVRIPRASLV